MQLTSALYVRQLIAKLHPPLPKSPRESQQLLSILQTSFKRHLDDVHPSPRAADPSNAVSVPNAPLMNRSTSAEAANYHLHSILSHPLLDQHHQTAQVLGSSPAERLLALFDAAVLHSKADLALIDKCLGLYHQTIGTAEKDGLAASLGSRIVLWFNSSNRATKEDFLANGQRMSNTLPILYSGSLQDVVWEWLRMIYEGELVEKNAESQYDKTSPVRLDVEDRFVASMLRESIRRNDISSAAQEFVLACEYRAKSGRAAVDFNSVSTDAQYYPMLASWKRMSYAIIRHRHSHGIAPGLYEKVVSFSVPFHHAPWWDRSVLSLYKPKSPSSQALYNRLFHRLSAEAWLSWANNLTEKAQRMALLPILDAAELELRQGNNMGSRFFMRFAERNFSKFLPHVQKASITAQVEHVRQEVESHTAGSQSFIFT